eukprot:TRINITY_DN28812_c0_g1_i1.p1 TRINITY_DN28812_c0_g1~~TRINITY_DN28812_c0_g1_i1.p1  ORF type:complete len:258 (-),score=117.40 TRINITY_DN28812_c0_g1_i1:171-944(-)
MESWQKLLLAAGSAAGVAAVLYYLLRDETDAEVKTRETVGGGAGAAAPGGGLAAAGGDSKKLAIEILVEMSKQQEKTKSAMLELAKEVAGQDLSFEKMYEKVKSISPEKDPLEAAGISPMQFDNLLQQHVQDPMVLQLLQQVMGGVSPGSISEEAAKISEEKVIEISQFMVEEIAKFVENFKKRTDKNKFDDKIILHMSQVMINVAMLQKYSISAHTWEGAVAMNDTKLRDNKDFLNTQHAMAMAMEELTQILAKQT